MATDFCPIRPGETEWNRDGRILGASGQPPHHYGHVQGRNIAASLASFQHHAQASCDLRRALQTTAYTAAQTGLATITYPALRERNQSIFECLALADAESRHPGAYQKWHSTGRLV